jgi:hypothetical protein
MMAAAAAAISLPPSAGGRERERAPGALEPAGRRIDAPPPAVAVDARSAAILGRRPRMHTRRTRMRRAAPPCGLPPPRCVATAMCGADGGADSRLGARRALSRVLSRGVTCHVTRDAYVGVACWQASCIMTGRIRTVLLSLTRARSLHEGEGPGILHWSHHWPHQGEG